jgi:hypothetical protein
MTTKALAAAILLSLVGAVAHAQGAVPVNPAVEVFEDGDEATEPDTRPHIQVLQHPYDIASFYRSSDGLVYGPYGGGSEHYPIAGFYRQGGGSGRYGYSKFWTHGYSAHVWGPGGNAQPRGHRGGGMGLGFGRHIGENGDLFLFAPAILGPVGPLTGVFFGDSLP